MDLRLFQDGCLIDNQSDPFPLQQTGHNLHPFGTGFYRLCSHLQRVKEKKQASQQAYISNIWIHRFLLFFNFMCKCNDSFDFPQ